MISLQTAFGLNEIPEFQEQIRNEDGDQGSEFGWCIAQQRFSEIVQFLLDLPDGQLPCDAHILDAKDCSVVAEFEPSDRVSNFGERILEAADTLPPQAILTINFEEPPVSVHFYSSDAVNLAKAVNFGGEQTDANLFIDFTENNPPSWLATPVIIAES